MSDSSRGGRGVDSPSGGLTRRSLLVGAAAAGLWGANEYVLGSDGGGSMGNGTADGPTLYVTSDDGIHALDAESGTVTWENTESFAGPNDHPVVADGTVYCVGSGGETTDTVLAADAATGEEVWTFPTGGRIRTTVTVAGDTVYVGSQDAEVLRAVNRRDGSRRWAFDVGGPVQSAPTVVDGTAYASALGTLVAVDVAGPSETWRTTPEGNSGIYSPQFRDGSLYVGIADGAYRVSADAGEIEWSTAPRGGNGSYTQVVHDGSLYLGDLGGPRLIALDASSGEYRWTFVAPAGANGAPTAVEDTVFATFGGAFGPPGSAAVCAIDAATGEERWRYAPDADEFGPSLTVADGLVYVCGPWTEVIALDASTGEEVWTTDLDTDVGGAPTFVETPADGYGAGSRARLGTHGHHGQVRT